MARSVISHLSSLRFLSPHKVKMHIHVKLGIGQVSLHSGDDDPRLVRRVSQDAGVQGQSVGFDGVDELGAIVHSQFLESVLLGPRADGDLVDFLVDVGEAGGLHVRLHGLGGFQDFAERLARFVHLLDPVEEVDGAVQGVVVAPHVALVVLHLEPAARVEGAEALAEQARPVGYTAAQGAAVDVVKTFAGRVGPFGLDVIDVEFDVGGDEGRLDRGEVDAHHDGFGVVVAEFDAVETRAAAEVEDALRLVKRGAVQMAAEDHFEDVVEHVETVLFEFVIGENVLALAVGVVATAIFVAVVEDGAGEGCCPRVV